MLSKNKLLNRDQETVKTMHVSKFFTGTDFSLILLRLLKHVLQTG